MVDEIKANNRNRSKEDELAEIMVENKKSDKFQMKSHIAYSDGIDSIGVGKGNKGKIDNDDDVIRDEAKIRFDNSIQDFGISASTQPQHLQSRGIKSQHIDVSSKSPSFDSGPMKKSNPFIPPSIADYDALSMKSREISLHSPVKALRTDSFGSNSYRSQSSHSRHQEGKNVETKINSGHRHNRHKFQVSVTPGESNSSNVGIIHRSDPDIDEQMMFEQRLCEDNIGVGVKKINHTGKSQLRYVRCVPLSTFENAGATTNSTTSKSSLNSFRNILKRKSSSNATQHQQLSLMGSYQDCENYEISSTNLLAKTLTKRSRALMWGNKKKVVLSLERFIAVRKGKTTQRTKKNIAPSSRLLSIITDSKEHPSLDIEAPTKLDRDKFARAFARFLGVPLEIDDDIESYHSGSILDLSKRNGDESTSDSRASSKSPLKGRANVLNPHGGSISSGASLSLSSSVMDPTQALAVGLLPAISPSTANSDDVAFATQKRNLQSEQRDKDQNYFSFSKGEDAQNKNAPVNIPFKSNVKTSVRNASKQTPKEKSPTPEVNERTRSQIQRIEENKSLSMNQERGENSNKSYIQTNDDVSDVSSITGGFDQEVVEELHNALNELRAELEASRAEAARAVKVAEQAIQSAESCTSNDWNSTVTHKAAEAAAQAQKQCAEAIAKQRLAEDRLLAERKSAAFWRRQAEAAEEEAGALQTRAAAVEIQRALMQQTLESEKRKNQAFLSSLKENHTLAEKKQKDFVVKTQERSLDLEIEMENVRREYKMKCEEVRTLQASLIEYQAQINTEATKNHKEKRNYFNRLGRKKSRSSIYNEDSSLSAEDVGSSLLLGRDMTRAVVVNTTDVVTEEKIMTLKKNSLALRNEFEILRRAMAEEIRALPNQAKDWAYQISRALYHSERETNFLKEKLALETALRRKLQFEVQDLRGQVRVFCRPRSLQKKHATYQSNRISQHDKNRTGTVSVFSHEILNLHRESLKSHKNKSSKSSLVSPPLTFKYDRVFTTNATQTEVYSEMEEIVLGALDGYNICVMAFGQSGSGKTHTILGDCTRTKPIAGSMGHWIKRDSNTSGTYFQTMEQLLAVAEQRQERYQDLFSVTILEVHGEKLCDLCAGTPISLERGETQGGDTQPTRLSRKHRSKSSRSLREDDDHRLATGRLEIRTNYDGDTVVQGLISIPVKNIEDVYDLWDQCLSQRARRITDSGSSLALHEADSHVFATINVMSTNIATGVGTVGKIQFVDLAASDIVPKRFRGTADGSNINETSSDSILSGLGNPIQWRFSNKSISTLNDVVRARSQFNMSPYRNSTLTHLLRDCLEGDSKVLFILCVSADEQDLQTSATALRFASRMRTIEIGKATKHTVSMA